MQPMDRILKWLQDKLKATSHLYDTDFQSILNVEAYGHRFSF